MFLSNTTQKVDLPNMVSESPELLVSRLGDEVVNFHCTSVNSIPEFFYSNHRKENYPHL